MGPRGFRRGRRRGLIVGAAVGASMANRGNQPAADQPAAQSVDGTDNIAKLQDLAKLKEQGILTDAEFQAEKAKILGS